MGVDRGLELALGGLQMSAEETLPLMEGLPSVQAHWLRQRVSGPGLETWRSVRLDLSMRSGDSAGDRRFSLGSAVAVGVGLSRPRWALEPGWSLGLRWIPPSGESATGSLESAGWLYLVSGPQLTLRLGPVERWSVTLQTRLDGAYLNLEPDASLAPTLHTAMGVWAGVRIPLP